MFVADEDRIEFIPRPRGESEVTVANIFDTHKKLGWLAKHSLGDYVHEYKKEQGEKLFAEHLG
jgi:hypothetical protein